MGAIELSNKGKLYDKIIYMHQDCDMRQGIVGVGVGVGDGDNSDDDKIDYDNLLAYQENESRFRNVSLSTTIPFPRKRKLIVALNADIATFNASIGMVSDRRYDFEKPMGTFPKRYRKQEQSRLEYISREGRARGIPHPKKGLLRCHYEQGDDVIFMQRRKEASPEYQIQLVELE